MLALGRSLLARGHSVTLAGPPDFAGDAARAGVEFRGMGRSMEGFLVRNSAAFHGNVLRLARAIKRDVDREVDAQFELLTGLAAEADRVVGASLAFAVPSCAEHAGRPYRFLAFAPDSFPSRYHPALGIGRQNLPIFVNRLSWWMARRLDNWLLRASINRGRVKLGLPAIDDVLDHFANPGCSLLATDAELAPAPSDVHVLAEPTGAMLYDEGEPLPEAVESFLAAGPPPIYIGFGSMPDACPDETRLIVAEALRLVGCRAIVYAGAGAAVPTKPRADLLTVGRLSHGKLFPRVAVAVHHGGAGTCSRAARAGIPQVILPHVLDQFSWAARLERRGLAPRPLFRRNLTSKALAGRIRQALENTDMREAAVKLALALAGRDGAGRAAAILSAG